MPILSGRALVPKRSRELSEMLHAYFRALQTGDAEALASVWHPRAKLRAVADDGELHSLRGPGEGGWFDHVRWRGPLPGGDGDSGWDALARVHAVHFADDRTALCKVQNAALGADGATPVVYPKFLSCARLCDGGWRVVSQLSGRPRPCDLQWVAQPSPDRGHRRLRVVETASSSREEDDDGVDDALVGVAAVIRAYARAERARGGDDAVAAARRVVHPDASFVARCEEEEDDDDDLGGDGGVREESARSYYDALEASLAAADVVDDAATSRRHRIVAIDTLAGGRAAFATVAGAVARHRSASSEQPPGGASVVDHLGLLRLGAADERRGRGGAEVDGGENGRAGGDGDDGVGGWTIVSATRSVLHLHQLAQSSSGAEWRE